jgi:hypothetical protein
MKKHALIPMSMILIALLAAGCNPQSSPTRGPDGPQGGPTQIINPGGPQDGGPGQGEPQQGGPGVGPGPGGGQPGGVQIDFRADNQTLQPGQCTTLHWNVQGAFNVRLDGQPVDPTGERQVCPKATTTYRLEVDAGDHVEMREVTIQVGGGNPPAPTQKSGGGPGPAATPTVKSGGGGGGVTPAATATPQGRTIKTVLPIELKPDLAIMWISTTEGPWPGRVNIMVKNIGFAKWSDGDVYVSCYGDYSIKGVSSALTPAGFTVGESQLDLGSDVYGYPGTDGYYTEASSSDEMYVTCRITGTMTNDSDISNNVLGPVQVV